MPEMIPQESNRQGIEHFSPLYQPWVCKYRESDRQSQSKWNELSDGERQNRSHVKAVSGIKK